MLSPSESVVSRDNVSRSRLSGVSVMFLLIILRDKDHALEVESVCVFVFFLRIYIYFLCCVCCWLCSARNFIAFVFFIRVRRVVHILIVRGSASQMFAVKTQRRLICASFLPYIFLGELCPFVCLETNTEQICLSVNCPLFVFLLRSMIWH